MASVKCVIKKDFGKITNGSFPIYLRLIEWNNNPAKYDLRGWSAENAAGKGVILSREELETLLALIEAVLAEEKPAPKKRGRKPKTTAVIEETKEEDDEDEEVTENKSNDNVVQFPGERPKIIELPKTNGKATVRECREKLTAEREIYKDGDSAYVIDKLLELCDKSQDFRNNVMREDKTYAGGFKYMSDQVRKGYCLKVANGVQYLDNELAYALFVDYYNMDEEAMKPKTEPKKRERSKK